MDALTKVFEEILQSKIESGELAKKAEDHITKLIDEVLSNQTRKYSDFGKIVEQKMKDAIGYATSQMNFETFSLLLCNNIKGNINKYYTVEAQKIMESRVEELLRPANLEEKTIAGILKAYKHSYRYDNEPINYYVEDEHGLFVTLYLGEGHISPHNKYQNATHWIGFYKRGKGENTGEVYSVRAKDRDIANDKYLIGSDFEALLFKILAGKDLISLDYDEETLDEICNSEIEDED